MLRGNISGSTLHPRTIPQSWGFQDFSEKLRLSDSALWQEYQKAPTKGVKIFPEP